MVLKEATPVYKEILPFLKHIYSLEDATVNLTRVIKGFGFKHWANIVEVNPDYAVLQTPEIRLYASLEGHCHVYSSTFASPIKAKIVDRSLVRRMVVLTGFTWARSTWVDRLQDRVQPKTPALVTLKTGRTSISASMIDLHPEGMGLFVRKVLVESAGLEENTPVELGVRLPPNYEWKHLKGEITHLEPAGNLLVRLGVRLEPGPVQRGVLEQYFASRKEDILLEVNQEYCRALEPRRVEDLFF